MKGPKREEIQNEQIQTMKEHTSEGKQRLTVSSICALHGNRDISASSRCERASELRVWHCDRNRRACLPANSHKQSSRRISHGAAEIAAIDRDWGAYEWSRD